MGITKLDERQSRTQRYRATRAASIGATSSARPTPETWLDDITASLVRGDYVDPRRRRITVSKWADSWMAGRVHLKPKTLESCRSLLDNACAGPRRGTVPLARITHADVVASVASISRRRPLGVRVRQAYHLLSSMLDAAVRDRRLSSNPAAEVDLPRMRKPEKRYLTHEQLHQLAAGCGRCRVDGADARLLRAALRRGSRGSACVAVST